jgi:hypothetical protein
VHTARTIGDAPWATIGSGATGEQPRKDGRERTRARRKKSGELESADPKLLGDPAKIEEQNLATLPRPSDFRHEAFGGLSLPGWRPFLF